MDDRALVAAAVEAPSSHNTQPWLFRPVAGGLELLADRSRALPVNDPNDRELTISCGAALMNLRVAAAGMGIGIEAQPCKDAQDGLLARIILHDGSAGDTRLAALAAAIPERYSTRGALVGELPRTLRDRLSDAVACEGAGLRFVEADQRAAIAALVWEGDRIQFSDPRWRDELAAWMRPRRSGDGLRGPPLVLPLVRFVLRHFDLGGRVAASDAAYVMSAPALLVITTTGDDPPTWLRCGQALQRMLLVAAGEGFQAGYLNQPCQIPALRVRLREALGCPGFPQLVLRLGRAQAPTRRTARREPDEVMPATDGRARSAR